MHSLHCCFFAKGYAMTLLSFKIWVILLIFSVAQLGAYLALKTKKQHNGYFLLSLGNTFSAGIFLGAGLIHMLPDASDEFSDILAGDFPYAAFVASLGFLLILFIEKVLAARSAVQYGTQTEEKQKYAPYILLFILSIHSIIVGIALGTENTMAQSIIIAIAVLAHKGSAAFALVVDMLKSHINTKTILKLVTLFSMMTPLGIVLGGILAGQTSGKVTTLLIATFDALAAGTFLYVAIMEIFSEEFNAKKHVLGTSNHRHYRKSCSYRTLPVYPFPWRLFTLVIRNLFTAFRL